MYQSRSSRLSRKNQIVINLIQTQSGFSVVEGEDLINKASNITIVIPAKEKPVHQVAKRQNIIIPIYPNITSKIIEHDQKYTTLPACASWFNIGTVHEIQRKALSDWFKNKKTLVSKNQKYEKNEDLYKKYRNYIVELGKTGYVSATRARKGLAGDACSIMRIHAFLEHWGIINYQYKTQVPSQQRELIMRFNEQEKLDLFEYDKKLISKNYSQEDTEILRKVTKKYRPCCDFCSQRCGIVWFQHRRNLNSKEITNIMKNVNSKNPPLSTAEYQIILCIKCYSEGNYNNIISATDFNKVTIQDKLNESKTKKRKGRETEGGAELIPEVEWTNEQVSELMDLIEKFGEDWESISKELKNRTPQECIQCFLTLPLKNISKLKFQYDPEEFVKENHDDLINDFSSTICQTAIEEVHKNPDPAMNSNLQQTPKQIEEQRRLYDEVLKLYLKKIEIKLEQLEEWESSVLKGKKEVEEGRKSVIAQKIRNVTK